MAESPRRGGGAVREHGWSYLNAIIDCCTREIAGWALGRPLPRPGGPDSPPGRRRRPPGRARPAGLGTDAGTAYTSRAFRTRLAEMDITHRRGGYRDPESQAFIESWFSKLKERCIWREEFETIDQARETIAAYIDRYHHRPHSRLAYKTPREVAAIWKDAHDDLIPAA